MNQLSMNLMHFKLWIQATGNSLKLISSPYHHHNPAHITLLTNAHEHGTNCIAVKPLRRLKNRPLMLHVYHLNGKKQQLKGGKQFEDFLNLTEQVWINNFSTFGNVLARVMNGEGSLPDNWCWHLQLFERMMWNFLVDKKLRISTNNNFQLLYIGDCLHRVSKVVDVESKTLYGAMINLEEAIIRMNSSKDVRFNKDKATRGFQDIMSEGNKRIVLSSLWEHLPKTDSILSNSIYQAVESFFDFSIGVRKVNRETDLTVPLSRLLELFEGTADNSLLVDFEKNSLVAKSIHDLIQTLKIYIGAFNTWPYAPMEMFSLAPEYQESYDFQAAKKKQPKNPPSYAQFLKSKISQDGDQSAVKLTHEDNWVAGIKSNALFQMIYPQGNELLDVIDQVYQHA
jgi:hypothetical protein